MERRGFSVTLIKPERTGVVDAEKVLAAVRDDTLLVSIMHVNNELGTIQPIDEIAEALIDSHVFLHSDAAQGYTKELVRLKHPRMDMISISGHKIRATKGVGGLLIRRRRYRFPPLHPLTFGGGQERGLRPGTHAVPFIAGLGHAAEIGVSEFQSRTARLEKRASLLLQAFTADGYRPTVTRNDAIASIISVTHPDRSAEVALMEAKIPRSNLDRVGMHIQ